MAEQEKKVKKDEVEIEVVDKSNEMVNEYVQLDTMNPEVKYIDVTINGKTWRLERGTNNYAPREVLRVANESIINTMKSDNPKVGVENLVLEGQEI